MKLSLNAQSLAQPSYLDEENARIKQDGYGLPSMIAAMAATDRTRLDQLERALHAVVPRAQRIRAPRAKVTRTQTEIITLSGGNHAVETAREQMGNRLEVEMQGAGWLDASLLSDGTLIALGILALLHSENSPKLLLIDDLDHSLHPKAYSALVTSLRKVMDEHPALQILCTTHAPYLLDCFEPEQVRVLSLDDNGYTHAVKLVDHPEWSEKMRGGLSTGEFWSTVGEQWATLNGHG
jgi:predicted ATPase